MKIFYNKLQNVPADFAGSPSLRKPALVVKAWKQQFPSAEVIRPRSATVDELTVAHSPSYVKSVLAGRTNNGFGNRNPAIAKALPWCVGSFICAAFHACRYKESTFSPTSGFHHAHFNHAAGYCTFNALTIAARLLKKFKLAARIGILDLDSHAGDGTEETLSKTNSQDFVQHYSLGYHQVDLFNNQQWLNALPRLITDNFADCDVLFYQAGVDCHQDDPFLDQGDFTTEQIKIRDLHVFETAKRLNLPVVTNLAGGYQCPLDIVINLHCQTAEAYYETTLE